MGARYVAVIKGDSDWITFSRAHFLKQALLSPTLFRGVYYFDPADPKVFMRDPGTMWTLFICGHGCVREICGCDGKTLADALAPQLPAEEGRINVMSCSTGKGSARAFCKGLKKNGKKVVVVAPKESCTFTNELFFRVLNPPTFTPTLAQAYNVLRDSSKVPGGDAASLANRVKSGEEISAVCKEMAEKSAAFWQSFSTKFAGCFSKVGEGWKEFSTEDY